MTDAFSTPVQLLRSAAFNRRPQPSELLAGQPAVNIDPLQPGLFFADESETALFKVGPCAVGDTAPNAGGEGAPGNTLGELWLNTNNDPALPGPALQVWDGTRWIDCMPYRTAAALISDTAPDINVYASGTLWWDSGSGLMYIAYDDGTSKQWTQISAATVNP